MGGFVVDETRQTRGELTAADTARLDPVGGSLDVSVRDIVTQGAERVPGGLNRATDGRPLIPSGISTITVATSLLPPQAARPGTMATADNAVRTPARN